MRVGVVLCLWLVGCAKKPADQTAKPADSATQVVIAGDGSAAQAAAPATPPQPVADCSAAHEAVMTNVRGAYIAKNTFAPRKEAVKKWATLPTSCRTGTWFLEAALLLNAGEPELTAGAIKLVSEEAALMLALQQPDHVDVLARVALVSALGRKPALPDDACARANAIADSDRDGIAYVCARAALAAGDGKTAMEQLATITSATRLPDLELARAQAAKLLADTKTRRAHAKLAAKLDVQRASAALIKERDRKAIVDLAKSLAK